MILLPILRSSAVSLGTPENSAIQKLPIIIIIIINTEYPRLSEESEKESRDEATQV